MLKLAKTIDCDVLVVGGGIGGLCAASSAAQGGAKTIVLEKANSLRSGSGATGNDHFTCYYPKAHGDDVGPILKELMDSMLGMCQDTQLSVHFLERSISMADRWHEWGINMKPFGDDYVFLGHAFPGRPRIFLKYDGHNQKEVLTRQAKKSGASILNHHPVLDLLYDEEGVCGALALDTSGPEPAFTVVKARSVILATGSTNRLYAPDGSPGSMFNTAFCPSCTGSGQAQAWRLGAKMVNVELPYRHAGPKTFARAGKNTWIGVYRYPDGKLLGPFVTQATREVGDITCDVWNTAFTDVLRNGTGPAYIDCSQTAPKEMAFMREGMISEGLTSLVNYMQRAGIDPHKDGVEFMQYEPCFLGRGLEIDLDGQTSLPGLYAAGDMVGNVRTDISGAALWGWMEGEHAAARRDRTTKALPDIENSAWATERMEYYNTFVSRRSGAHWKEANRGIQQILGDYAAAGPVRVRSETLLNAGIRYLKDLRHNSEQDLYAANAHELLRLAETMDLMDNAEAILHAALERRETRFMHIRSDYTFTNPLLNDKFLNVWREKDGKVVTRWRKRWNV